MKRTGKKRVRKGQVTMSSYNQDYNRIQLFDGRFTTGYRITEFRICPSQPTNSEEIVSTLTSEPLSGVPSTLDFGLNTLQAVSIYNAPNQTEHSEWKLIVSDNMVIEDLWIAFYTSGDDTLCNYYIELEQYSFPAWTGAATLVENLSQGGPQ